MIFAVSSTLAIDRNELEIALSMPPISLRIR